MSLRVGTDITVVSRFARVASRARGRALVFTPAELAGLPDVLGPHEFEHLAGRFSAKESVAKVLGRGLGQGLTWQDVEVLRDPYGRPVVRLHRHARVLADELGLGTVEVSISHADDHAVSTAVALAWPSATDDARRAGPE